METNGITKIIVGGKEYPLLFGRAAVEEMSRRSSEKLSNNGVKLLTDLVYSGLLNRAIKDDSEFPSYSDVYDLVEDFQLEEDSSEQYEKIWKIFESSRWGSQWLEKLNEIKKKVDLAMEELLTGNQSEDLL